MRVNANRDCWCTATNRYRQRFLSHLLLLQWLGILLLRWLGILLLWQLGSCGRLDGLLGRVRHLTDNSDRLYADRVRRSRPADLYVGWQLDFLDSIAGARVLYRSGDYSLYSGWIDSLSGGSTVSARVAHCSRHV